jgi:hypothetical protein
MKKIYKLVTICQGIGGCKFILRGELNDSWKPQYCPNCGKKETLSTIRFDKTVQNTKK